MAKKEKTLMEWISNKRLVAHIFLGVGLVLFLMNITGMLNFLPRQYSYLSFDISVFSSMLVIIFAVYILHYDIK